MKFTSFVKGLPTKEKIPFIASLSVIMLGALALIAYGIFTLVGIIGLNNYKIEFYSPPFADYVRLDYYSANRGELLGEGDLYHTYYELDGLSQENYLLIDEASGFTTVSHKDIVVMNKESAEPILCYDVKRVDISNGDQGVVSITDTAIIESILEQRRNGEYVIKEHGTSYAENATMYFNLPCELTLECIIVKEGDEVLLLCYDHVSFDWCEYDVTQQLSELLY